VQTKMRPTVKEMAVINVGPPDKVALPARTELAISELLDADRVSWAVGRGDCGIGGESEVEDVKKCHDNQPASPVSKARKRHNDFPQCNEMSKACT
jgi:hypothetical protein